MLILYYILVENVSSWTLLLKVETEQNILIDDNNYKLPIWNQWQPENVIIIGVRP